MRDVSTKRYHVENIITHMVKYFLFSNTVKPDLAVMKGQQWIPLSKIK